MLKIPSIKKFKGDNEVSFTKWILHFEAQSDEKKKKASTVTMFGR